MECIEEAENAQVAQSSISPSRESVLAVVLVPIVSSSSFGSVLVSIRDPFPIKFAVPVPLSIPAAV